MLKALATGVFGSRNDRLVKQMGRTVVKINALEPQLQELSDDQLKAKTEAFKARLAKGAKLNSLLPEAFAVVREASKRAIGLRHYDVQMIGGMVLNSGKIAEMQTGEGKTLVATLPLYLNALTGKGAHLVTVNDYLAKRDAHWMGKVYAFLGMTTGIIVANMDQAARKAAYACDITYGTNNEFGFDYLRDNMAFSLEEQVQRDLNFAVVDEVDSILIDEARTPLIISGPSETSSEHYHKLNQLVPKLTKCEKEDAPGDYYVDEKTKQAFLTEAGHQNTEDLLVKAGLLKLGESLYSPNNVALMHYVNAALRACAVYQRDVDYIVSDGEIMIVDEHTGRAMPGRRWSDGLHQAVEAKEGLNVQGENQTMASITYQNFFRLYNKLSGMTGTADTEAYEFHQIYDLEVVVIPTNTPRAREDHPDMVFLTQAEKFEAILKEIKRVHKTQQPLLVGTASVETSEYLEGLLKKAKIPHQVLNAKQHEREAHVIAQAGKPGAVTISTNMAGRGTDIVLGGSLDEDISALESPTDAQIAKLKQAWQQRHDEALALGGLYVLGTERHESRRIDNQLRGRSGRQGDPGTTRFYLSLEDHVIRIFAPKWLGNFMRKAGMGNGEPLESKMVTKAITNAQRKVEGYHFDIRKQLLQYDDVANDQRLVIYQQRDELLGTEDVSPIINDIRDSVIETLYHEHIPPESIEEQWDIKELEMTLKADFNVDIPITKWLESDESLNEETLLEKVQTIFAQSFTDKEAMVEPQAMKQFQKMVLLQSLDTHWREHLNNIDHLRNSINLRGYAQRDPKQEYKRESFELFSDMLDRFKYDVISIISKVEIQQPEEVAAAETQWHQSAPQYHLEHGEDQSILNQNASQQQAMPLQSPEHYYNGQKIGRNELCPCGSGKKFKQCHGKLV